MPIYRVPSSETHPNVTVVNNYSSRTENWPIPTYAQPASAEDHHLGVMYPQDNIIYEFWDAQWSGTSRINAGGMKDFPLNGNGISNPPNHRVNAAGFATIAGMIIREDFTTGGNLNPNSDLGHALTMSLNFDKVATGDYVAPAVGGETLGRGGNVPIGARFALPKDADIENLQNVHPLTKTILKSLRDYGAFVNDTNGSSQYQGKYVGTIRLEPGLAQDLYNSNGDNLVNTIQQQTYQVINQYGLYRVTGINY